MLGRNGSAAGTGTEEANLRAPDAVVSLHVSFINAGSDLIETNTFGANRFKLAVHGLASRVRDPALRARLWPGNDGPVISKEQVKGVRDSTKRPEGAAH